MVFIDSLVELQNTVKIQFYKLNKATIVNELVMQLHKILLLHIEYIHESMEMT